MSSYQCIGFDYKKKLTHEMCFPSNEEVIRKTKQIIELENADYLLVATDKNPMINEFQKVLPNTKVRNYSNFISVYLFSR